ncbi:MAG: hypothetical protein WAM64_05395 [Acidimicrobiales bacterium]
MLRRIFRMVTAGLLGRAWAQKSPAWLSLALAVVLFRFFDSRAAKSARRAKSVSS